jgi:hypothetical protein
MVRLLGAMIGAVAGLFSNGYATSPSVSFGRQLIVVLHTVGAILLTVEVALAQEPVPQPNTAATHSGQAAASAGLFLAGAGVALAAHESGHLLFDAIFEAHPGIKRVSFHGLPFFAITHDSGLSPRQEFVIDSAGFWVQEATNELILTRRPGLRREHAPFVKGVFAFNVLASVGYAGAAFARTGPAERDTRGMADSLRWKEPAVGVLILIPALLDAFRYYHPDAKWAVWGSRAAKIGGVVLVAK